MIRLCVLIGLAMAMAHPVRAELRAGAASIDITPPFLPVLVNGGFLSRSESNITSRLHARALALHDAESIAIVVVDTCMMGRPLIDEAKALAAERTGLATNRILIAATHTHSAPSAFACLGTQADPRYVPFLRNRIVDAIEAARSRMEPARIGWARANAAEFTALRRWIRRSDRIAEDPFGNRTVRANMHAAANWDDVTGEAGPEDPDLSLISVQGPDGKPIAVLGNFSMHYFGEGGIGADYFGRFCERLRARIAPEHTNFVAILSHGCSGDIWRVDYTIPRERRPDPSIDAYTDSLVEIAVRALADARHEDADLAMAERRFTLNYRVPDRQRLEWAERIVAAMGDRPPANLPEVYAMEQVILHERQRTEVVVQAVRVGDIAIATTPTETYAITGLKIKAASPLPRTIVLDLANGGDGYIPPPEQHLLGGYNTWPARSAGLEVTAEPKIAEAAIRALEEVAGKPRRVPEVSNGPAARAILESRPLAYWRLNEFTGPHAVDATGNGRDAVYEPAVAYYLEGPASERYSGADSVNRAPHFAGGRLRARVPGLQDQWTVCFWAWNGLPTDAREVTGWMFSRGPDFGAGPGTLHLGIGGGSTHAGRLLLLEGEGTMTSGRTEIPRWSWHHIAVVRDGTTAHVYMDGRLEITAQLRDRGAPVFDQLFFGGRSDGESGLEGRLDEIAVFDRALSAAEVQRLAR